MIYFRTHYTELPVNIKTRSLHICCNCGKCTWTECKTHRITQQLDTRKLPKPLKRDSKEIKGHQDDCTTAHHDRLAFLNIRMDLQAKKTSPGATMGESLISKNLIGIVVRNLREEVIHQVQGPPCLQYWYDKNRFEPGDSKAVGWQATARAMKLFRIRYVST